jgi:hypothetical protein
VRCGKARIRLIGKGTVMRIRPIGPGIGGLNYSSMLQDAHTLERPVSRPGAPARQPGPAGAGQAGRIWSAITAAAGRAGRRFVEARMAQARLMIDRASRSYGIDTRPGGAGSVGTRYY